jgi:dihydrofolate reductase
MRKVIILMHVSRDGFVAGPNGEMDWITMNEEEQNNASEILSTVDTVLFGRVTYQMMEHFWPTVPTHPALSKSKYHMDHSLWIEDTAKIVFSTTLDKTVWNNSRLVKDKIAEEVLSLKRQPGKNMIVIGSPGLVHTLMQHGLIDEYRINVNPVIIGSGIPLFEDINDRIRLKLIKSNTFNSGVVGLHYESEGQG